MDSFASSHIVSNIFSGSESILQFNKGVEKDSKFLPSNNLFFWWILKISLQDFWFSQFFILVPSYFFCLNILVLDCIWILTTRSISQFFNHWFFFGWISIFLFCLCCKTVTLSLFFLLLKLIILKLKWSLVSSLIYTIFFKMRKLTIYYRYSWSWMLIQFLD